MKSHLFGLAAIAALASASPADAQGTAPDTERSIADEIRYLRDIIALQTMRLDEAEQTLQRQTKEIEAQRRKIRALEQTYAGSGYERTADMAGSYTVLAGDTLYSIARRHGVEPATLADANGVKSAKSLKVGQRLVVPGLGKPRDIAGAPAPAAVAPQQVAAVEPSERPDVTKRALDAASANAPSPEAPAPRSEGPQEVGVRPQDPQERPEVTVLSDVGGILTPKGTLVAEPAVEYAVTSDNRFYFNGVEFIDSIFVGIGAIEATDSDRRAKTASLALRYGITNRLEIDGRVALVDREDSVTGVAIDDRTALSSDLSGRGLGDVEAGVHYQLTDGQGFPYTILNLRAKAPTGVGPFEVDTDPASGLDINLATGSGFWTLEPSVTFILPTDPAVIFANVGYQANLTDYPDRRQGDVIVREFRPGDAVRVGLGLGLAVNDRFSISMGYDHSSFLSTRLLVEDLSGPTPAFSWRKLRPTTVGSLLVGGSYAVNDRLRINLNTAFGATDSAPDIRVNLKAQIRLFD
jgi:LysM repeat protein